MTKLEFIEAIAAKSGLTKADSARAVEAFQSVVTETLKKGDKVTLTGFGVFSVSKREARNGRNPRTGEVVKIAASKSVKFKTGSKLKEAVNKEFSPEFRNRLDAIVPFVPLTKQIAVSIAKKEIQNLNQRLAPKNVCIEVTDKCLEFLVEEGYSKEFGARNMSRTVENLISSALVDEVLFGRLEKGGKAIVDVDNAEKIKFIFG